MDDFDFAAFAKTYAGATTLTMRAGTVVYRQGEAADCLFYILAGQVRIKLISPQGKEAIMAALDADGFCGETCLLGEPARVSTAVCLTKCTMVRIERANARRALRSDRRFAEFLLARCLRRNVRLRATLISHLFETGEQRLARILLMLANYGKDGAHQNIIDGLDQEELAQIVGTTRARVSYFMNRFRRLGYIDYDSDRIAVHRSLAKVLVHDLPLYGAIGPPEA